MSPKKYAAFRIDHELLDGLEFVWERDGITAPEQVRRAIRMWLEQKGVTVKVGRKPMATRKGQR